MHVNVNDVGMWVAIDFGEVLVMMMHGDQGSLPVVRLPFLSLYPSPLMLCDETESYCYRGMSNVHM